MWIVFFVVKLGVNGETLWDSLYGFKGENS